MRVARDCFAEEFGPIDFIDVTSIRGLSDIPAPEIKFIGKRKRRHAIARFSGYARPLYFVSEMLTRLSRDKVLSWPENKDVFLAVCSRYSCRPHRTLESVAPLFIQRRGFHFFKGKVTFFGCSFADDEEYANSADGRFSFVQTRRVCSKWQKNQDATRDALFKAFPGYWALGKSATPFSNVLLDDVYGVWGNYNKKGNNSWATAKFIKRDFSEVCYCEVCGRCGKRPAHREKVARHHVCQATKRLKRSVDSGMSRRGGRMHNDAIELYSIMLKQTCATCADKISRIVADTNEVFKTMNFINKTKVNRYGKN